MSDDKTRLEYLNDLIKMYPLEKVGRSSMRINYLEELINFAKTQENIRGSLISGKREIAKDHELSLEMLYQFIELEISREYRVEKRGRRRQSFLGRRVASLKEIPHYDEDFNSGEHEYEEFSENSSKQECTCSGDRIPHYDEDFSKKGLGYYITNCFLKIEGWNKKKKLRT